MTPRADRPLAGLRVLVTRRGDRGSLLAELLRREGAEPIELPVLATMPAPEETLDAALDAVAGAAWVLFTAATGVELMAEHARARSRDHVLASARIAAVGSATGAAIERAGWPVAFLPAVAEGGALGRELPARPGDRVVVLQATGARPDLRAELEARGAEVDVHPIYETARAADVPTAAGDAVRRGEVDCVTFTSGSTVDYLLETLQPVSGGAGRSPLGCAIVACIGPVTEARARERGLAPAIVAREQTLDGLVEAMKRYFQAREHGT